MSTLSPPCRHLLQEDVIPAQYSTTWNCTFQHALSDNSFPTLPRLLSWLDGDVDGFSYLGVWQKQWLVPPAVRKARGNSTVNTVLPEGLQITGTSWYLQSKSCWVASTWCQFFPFYLCFLVGHQNTSKTFTNQQLATATESMAINKERQKCQGLSAFRLDIYLKFCVKP